MNKEVDELFKKVANKGYKYYYGYTYCDIVKEAFENERKRMLNCHDGYFDKSTEASNRRIMEDIKRLRKKRGW